MKHYTQGQFTITFPITDGVPAATVVAMLAQLKPGAVIDYMAVDPRTPLAGTRRFVVNYHEPAEKDN
jgi:hypothetical protein